jgi:hypothetical protein
MELCYLFGDLDTAARMFELSRELMAASRGALYTADHVFFGALIAVARGANGASLDEARWTLARWANTCPENFLAKHLLVEAEAARQQREEELAAGTYARALDAAREQQNPKLEALVGELAGRYHLERDRQAEAATYLRHAHYAYNLWGAVPKARALRDKHRDLLADRGPSQR